MEKKILLFSALLVFSFLFSQSFAQSSNERTYSGTVHTFTNLTSIKNNTPETKLAVNSELNESVETGHYKVYFTYSSNYDGIKKGIYKIKIYRYVGDKVHEVFYDLNIGVDMPRFYDSVDLMKGVYSIRVFNEDNVLLGFSDYFNVTSQKEPIKSAGKE